MKRASWAKTRRFNPEAGLDERIWHPGLLWKEALQHRRIFTLFFLLIMMESLGAPLLLQGFMALTGSMAMQGLNPWAWVVSGIVRDGSSNTEIIAIGAVILLAALMVAGERGGSLNYLVSTPVNRRQILLAKWITGSAAITFSMLLLTVYMAVAAFSHPASVTVNAVLIWGGRTTAALLCLFSLAVLSASLCTGVLYSFIVTLFLTGLPLILGGIILIPAHKYSVLSAYQVAQAYYWINCLSIVDCITAENWYGQNVSLLPLQIALLLIASGLFLLLSVRAFESNPLENNGEVLLSGHFKQLGCLILAVLFAPLAASELAGSFPLFILYVFLLIPGIYLAINLLWRVMARLGLSGTVISYPGSLLSNTGGGE